MSFLSKQLFQGLRVFCALEMQLLKSNKTQASDEGKASFNHSQLTERKYDFVSAY